MKALKLLFLAYIIIATSCIGDDFVQDFVEPQTRIGTAPQSLAAGDQFQLDPTFLNNVGQVSNDVIFNYESSNKEIVSVTNEGLVTGLQMGTADVTVTAVFETEEYSDKVTIEVAEETVTIEPSIKSGTIVTTSSYRLEGTFEIESADDGIVININEDYVASQALPGLVIYLTNNKNTNAGALEIGPVSVFSGAHSYTVPNVTPDDFSHILYFCKPFGVKVGDGLIEDN